MPLGIPVLHDALSGHPVEARLVLAGDKNVVSLLRDSIRRERKAKISRYCCGLCRDPVYVSNSGGTSHFAHYADSGPRCAWRAECSRSLDAISAGRFRGMQEGELHARLLLTLQALCERCSGFTDVGVPNQTLFGMPGTGHRFPDLQAHHDGRSIVFELQLSKTYLPVISDREDFYRQNGIYLFWLFHDFERHCGRQTEQDVTAKRSRQAFELDDEAIRFSLESGSLTLKAYWQEQALGREGLTWQWASRLVRIEDLHFDEYLVEAQAANPWRDEARLLAEYYAPLVGKFEKFWHERPELARRLSNEAIQRVRQGLPVETERTITAVTQRAFKSLFTASGLDSSMVDRVEDLHFHDLLHRVIFLRDGVNRFNRQDLGGAVDTVLQNWPHFTDAIVAIGTAYGRDKVLRRPNILAKIERNLKGAEEEPPVPQCHDFDAALALLCPKSAAWVRATALPKVMRWEENGSETAPLSYDAMLSTADA